MQLPDYLAILPALPGLICITRFSHCCQSKTGAARRLTWRSLPALPGLICITRFSHCRDERDAFIPQCRPHSPPQTRGVRSCLIEPLPRRNQLQPSTKTFLPTILPSLLSTSFHQSPISTLHPSTNSPFLLLSTSFWLYAFRNLLNPLRPACLKAVHQETPKDHQAHQRLRSQPSQSDSRLSA